MNSYHDQISRAQARIDKKVEDVTRQTALIIYGEIVRNTPVDTGRARGNWNIDINMVDRSTDNPDNKNGDTSRADPVVARYKLDDRIFISNHLPYIARLNDGHSGQSPAGFVDTAIQVGKRKGKEIAKR